MKLLFFDDYRLGVLKDNDQVVDVSAAVSDVPHIGPHDIINGVIERWDVYKSKIEQAAASGQGKPVAGVKIRPPLPRPTTIVCMAVNFMEGRPEPPPINAFIKSPSAIIGHGDTMVLPDVPATIFEGEAELGIVIGKKATNVARADAMSYIFGYTNFIDGSARGLPPELNGLYAVKSRDTFAPIGPYIVTADEVPDPLNLQVRLYNNGALMQDFNTDDMAHKIDRCIEWASSVHTLVPGDLLTTGTVHSGLNPFMDGDKVELEIEGLGRLAINVRDDLKRKWARETRGDRIKKGLTGMTPQIEGKHTPAQA